MTDQRSPVNNEKLATILRRVRAMLDKAESTEFEEEAKTYRAKAEEFMRQYRIAEEDLITEDKISATPEWLEIVFNPGRIFARHYVTLLLHVARHAGARIEYRYRWNDAKFQHEVHAQLVGYSGDLRMVEWLFSAARLAFGEALEPEVKSELTVAQNIYRLRSAGLERNRIAALVFGEATHANNARVTKAYAAECAARGESPTVAGRTVNASTYREAYAEAFVQRFASRLRQARDAADSVGGALVLHGRKERVDEAFYARFPEYRPSTDLAITEPRECPDCKKTKSATGKCRIHRPYRVTKADMDRYERANYSDAALAGKASGRAAADSVELAGPTRRAKIDDGGQARDAAEVRRMMLGM